MNFLKNVKVGGKLFFGFGLMVVIIVGIAFFGARNLRQINERYTYALTYPLERWDILSEMGLELVNSRRLLNRAALYVTRPEDIDFQIDRRTTALADSRQTINDLIARFQANVNSDPELTADERNVRLNAINSYQAEIDRYFDFYVRNLLETARALDGLGALAIVDGVSRQIARATYHHAFLHETAGNFMHTIGIELSAQTTRIYWLLITLAVVTGFLGIAAAIVITKVITKPLVKLNSALGEVASGDLTKRLPEEGRDEIAVASRSYNQSMDEFGKMIGSVKSQSEMLTQIGNDLASNMTETASAMNEIAANIQSIKGRVLNQSASVTETNSTMEQVTNNINRLNEQIEGQAAAVSQSSSSIEEMLANIQSVTATLVKNAANVKELQDSSDTGRISLQDVSADIRPVPELKTHSMII
jgi:methyl-accepting chemotaxis protein